MIIPHRSLSPDTLQNLIEQFVLSEGTDYGEQEHSLADKVNQVMQQLDAGIVVVVYSELHESVNILPRDAIPPADADMPA